MRWRGVPLAPVVPSCCYLGCCSALLLHCVVFALQTIHRSDDEVIAKVVINTVEILLSKRNLISFFESYHVYIFPFCAIPYLCFDISQDTGYRQFDVMCDLTMPSKDGGVTFVRGQPTVCERWFNNDTTKDDPFQN